MRRKKDRKKRRILKVVLILVGLLLIGGGAYGYYVYNDVKQTVDTKMHDPVSTIDIEHTQRKVKERETLNVLLLGIDERQGDSGRSDTMIVMTLDPNNDRMQMISIPRDTRTTIEGEGMDDKINHAYAFGGTEMAVDTVEKFLDIDLDYYVRMNMEGLAQLVDSVGGIEVENDRAFQHNGNLFKEGKIQLNGEEALSFVRMRKEDPDGDAGRNQRQRQVIQGVIEKGASISGVNKYQDILHVLGNNVSTNMSFENMRNLAMNYRSARSNIESYQMTGQGQRIDDIYYLIVSDEEIEKVNKMIEEFQS
ncbi:LCP family glycopolymer transferase [Alteribacillus bidgolensis]|uniref:Transcriptional attenuator, LytR family n=1 Tax=Alteribacillus bidgolensis TaxID=930129 RepID=A0A1G8PPR1_9BACI|nr:LCP family protein [Alteribacillus bidgolensis]SDI94423.1 transcriptional attenuator, LytR family [Alteribacillus bidgolensis]